MFHLPSTHALRAALAAALLASALHADVLVIDADAEPGSDFATLAGAVAAAQPGDTLLFRAGTYFSAPIDGLPLTLAADTGAIVQLLGTLEVSGLAAGEQLVLRGLTLRGSFLGDDALRVQSSAGTVLVEDCLVQAPLLNNGVALHVVDGGDVIVVHSTLAGSAVDTLAPTDGAGLLLEGGRVLVYGGEVGGGTGINTVISAFGPDAPGRAAAALVDGELSTFGTSLRGGDGGSGVNPFGGSPACARGGDGGPGLLLLGAGARALLRDTSVTGGAGGSSLAACSAGADADDVANPGGGVVASVDEVSRSWQSAGPAREGESLALAFSGAPGDGVLLALAPSLDVSTLGPKGALLLTPPLTLLALGSLDADGALLLELTAPALPGGLDGVVVPAQLLAVPAAGGLRLGNAGALVLLDAAL